MIKKFVAELKDGRTISVEIKVLDGAYTVVIDNGVHGIVTKIEKTLEGLMEHFDKTLEGIKDHSIKVVVTEGEA